MINYQADDKETKMTILYIMRSIDVLQMNLIEHR